MKIAVCIKQVPAGQEAEIDRETGLLIREKTAARLNPYDYFAIEAALCAREKNGGEVTAVTMGPPGAKDVLRQAFELGADRGALVSGPAFAGADVYATAYTLSQALRALGGFDLIFCGRQTTDGDTAQTGPALAEQLGIPSISWISEILEVTPERIAVRQDLSGWELFAACPLPCVAAVGRECNTPRMPTLRGKMAAAKKEPLLLRIEDFFDKTPAHFGAEGSPTRVTRVFAPERAKAGEWLQGTEQEILAQATARIRAQIKSGGNVHDGDFGG